MKIVPNAKINSSQFTFPMARGTNLRAPKTPEAFFAARVCDSLTMSSG